MSESDWPMWAAAVWCEVCREGSHQHLMTLKFVQAPDIDNARAGALRMLREDYPAGSDFEAIVSKIPASGTPS